MVLRIYVLAGVSVAGIMGGCISSDLVDAWYKEPNIAWTELEEDGWGKIDSFYIVPGRMQAEAIERLCDNSIIKLSREEYISYGVPCDDSASDNYYLVRSLIYYSNPGGYRVYLKGDTLLVFHGSLGRKRVPVLRQAMIVRLEQEIHHLYVYCDQAM